MQTKLWILTEERPKPKVIQQILTTYCHEHQQQFSIDQDIKIKPIIKQGYFQFQYQIENVHIHNIDEIYLMIVSGSSSFVDFLVFSQQHEPDETNLNNHLIMVIEETKTSDQESRNSSIYQRATKFVYVKHYFPNTSLYMIYNHPSQTSTKKPSPTNIFGTNMLMTLGVKFIGMEHNEWYSKFDSVDELIRFKHHMQQPHRKNVPLTITKFDDRIEISGRLSKPSNRGNIGHDPNIGAISLISACLRKLGWKRDILITSHGISQAYLDKIKGQNKFLYICKLLDLKLEHLTLPHSIQFPNTYWHYEGKSEKVADIFLHLQTIYHGAQGIYENHAGCERGYFITKDGQSISLPKKDLKGNKLSLPDIILYDQVSNCIVIVEGKRLATLKQGLEDIKQYQGIEKEYIWPHYGQAEVKRYLSIFGGNSSQLPHEKVLFYLSENGHIIINEIAPEFIKKAFSNLDNVFPKKNHKK